jgi:hypothetical protein
MDKLLDVSRQGGYPWCAETASVLNDSIKGVEYFLYGFAEPITTIYTAIVLRQNRGSAPTMMALAMEDLTGYRIVKTTCNIPKTHPDFPKLEYLQKFENRKKYKLIDRSQQISINKENSETDVYEDAILHEEYELVLADVPNSASAWSIYYIRDIVREHHFVFRNLETALDYGEHVRQKWTPSSLMRINALGHLEVSLWVTIDNLLAYTTGATIHIANITHGVLEAYALTGWEANTFYPLDSALLAIKITSSDITAKVLSGNIPYGGEIHIDGVFPLFSGVN